VLNSPPQKHPRRPQPKRPQQKHLLHLLKNRSFYEVNALINLPYFIDHRLGLEFAGYALGKETKYVGPVDYDMTAMINAFEQAIRRKTGRH
jgi:hypothetical protein